MNADSEALSCASQEVANALRQSADRLEARAPELAERTRMRAAAFDRIRAQAAERAAPFRHATLEELGTIYVQIATAATELADFVVALESCSADEMAIGRSGAVAALGTLTRLAAAAERLLRLDAH